MSQYKPTLEKQLISHLDEANQALPENVKTDIAYARRRALQQAQQQQTNTMTAVFAPIRHLLFKPSVQWATPAALAAAVTLYVSYTPMNIPELPAELLDEDIPTVNVALLQDLEFANWLAEQDDEALL